MTKNQRRSDDTEMSTKARLWTGDVESQRGYQRIENPPTVEKAGSVLSYLFPHRFFQLDLTLKVFGCLHLFHPSRAGDGVVASGWIIIWILQAVQLGHVAKHVARCVLLPDAFQDMQEEERLQSMVSIWLQEISWILLRVATLLAMQWLQSMSLEAKTTAKKPNSAWFRLMQNFWTGGSTDDDRFTSEFQMFGVPIGDIVPGGRECKHSEEKSPCNFSFQGTAHCRLPNNPGSNMNTNPELRGSLPCSAFFNGESVVMSQSAALTPLYYRHVVRSHIALLWVIVLPCTCTVVVSQIPSGLDARMNSALGVDEYVLLSTLLDIWTFVPIAFCSYLPSLVVLLSWRMTHYFYGLAEFSKERDATDTETADAQKRTVIRRCKAYLSFVQKSSWTARRGQPATVLTLSWLWFFGLFLSFLAAPEQLNASLAAPVAAFIFVLLPPSVYDMIRHSHVQQAVEQYVLAARQDGQTIPEQDSKSISEELLELSPLLDWLEKKHPRTSSMKLQQRLKRWQNNTDSESTLTRFDLPWTDIVMSYGLMMLYAAVVSLFALVVPLIRTLLQYPLCHALSTSIGFGHTDRGDRQGCSDRLSMLDSPLVRALDVAILGSLLVWTLAKIIFIALSGAHQTEKAMRWWGTVGTAVCMVVTLVVWLLFADGLSVPFVVRLPQYLLWIWLICVTGWNLQQGLNSSDLPKAPLFRVILSASAFFTFLFLLLDVLVAPLYASSSNAQESLATTVVVPFVLKTVLLSWAKIFDTIVRPLRHLEKLSLRHVTKVWNGDIANDNTTTHTFAQHWKDSADQLWDRTCDKTQLGPTWSCMVKFCKVVTVTPEWFLGGELSKAQKHRFGLQTVEDDAHNPISIPQQDLQNTWSFEKEGDGWKLKLGNNAVDVKTDEDTKWGVHEADGSRCYTHLVWLPHNVDIPTAKAQLIIHTIEWHVVAQRVTQRRSKEHCVEVPPQADIQEVRASRGHCLVVITHTTGAAKKKTYGTRRTTVIASNLTDASTRPFHGSFEAVCADGLVVYLCFKREKDASELNNASRDRRNDGQGESKVMDDSSICFWDVEDDSSICFWDVEHNHCEEFEHIPTKKISEVSFKQDQLHITHEQSNGQTKLLQIYTPSILRHNPVRFNASSCLQLLPELLLSVYARLMVVGLSSIKDQAISLMLSEVLQVVTRVLPKLALVAKTLRYRVSGKATDKDAYVRAYESLDRGQRALAQQNCLADFVDYVSLFLSNFYAIFLFYWYDVQERPSVGALALSIAVQVVIMIVSDMFSLRGEQTFLRRPVLQQWVNNCPFWVLIALAASVCIFGLSTRPFFITVRFSRPECTPDILVNSTC